MIYKYGQKLPKDITNSLNTYIKRIEAIKWLQPENIDKPAIERQVKIALSCFSMKAKIEYRSLKNQADWDAALDAALDAAWGAALDAAWGAAQGAAWGAALDAALDAARGAAWGAALDAAWGAAQGAAELLSSDLDYFKEKYPEGAFLQLIPLWEMGLYPIGVIDGKFVIYMPEIKQPK